MKHPIVKILLGIIVFFAVIQLIPVDFTNKPVKKSENFVDLFQTPGNIRQTLKNSCYDCHSNETEYPQYVKIAPISWSIKHHVNEGREHLNFSEWGTFNQDLKRNMLENSIADLQQNRMPKEGYVAQHPEARLTPEAKNDLINYLSELLKSGTY